MIFLYLIIEKKLISNKIFIFTDQMLLDVEIFDENQK